MGKDKVDKAANLVKHGVEDAKDGIHEGQHRVAAEIEKAQRKTRGTDMTAFEKAESLLLETKNRAQAKVDAAKRNVRDHR
ncbi:MAG: hypothetical protein ACYDEU_09465 [Vulcanimicrobiaceae bacterium]|jgi:hypothetical protein